MGRPGLAGRENVTLAMTPPEARYSSAKLLAPPTRELESQAGSSMLPIPKLPLITLTGTAGKRPVHCRIYNSLVINYPAMMNTLPQNLLLPYPRAGGRFAAPCSRHRRKSNALSWKHRLPGLSPASIPRCRNARNPRSSRKL